MAHNQSGVIYYKGLTIRRNKGCRHWEVYISPTEIYRSKSAEDCIDYIDQLN